MPNPVSYFELGGANSAKLREFYADLFGWTINKFDPPDAMGEYYHIEATERGLGGGIMQTGGEMPPNYVMIYISVDDLDGYLEKAESLGGDILVRPFDIPGGMGRIAVFQDPDGNVMGLHKS